MCYPPLPLAFCFDPNTQPRLSKPHSTLPLQPFHKRPTFAAYGIFISWKLMMSLLERIILYWDQGWHDEHDSDNDDNDGDTFSTVTSLPPSKTARVVTSRMSAVFSSNSSPSWTLNNKFDDNHTAMYYESRHHGMCQIIKFQKLHFPKVLKLPCKYPILPTTHISHMWRKECWGYLEDFRHVFQGGWREDGPGLSVARNSHLLHWNLLKEEISRGKTVFANLKQTTPPSNARQLFSEK